MDKKTINFIFLQTIFHLVDKLNQLINQLHELI